MKKTILLLSLSALMLAGCSMSLLGTPTATPSKKELKETQAVFDAQTLSALPASPTAAPTLLSTPTNAANAPTVGIPTGVVVTGQPSMPTTAPPADFCADQQAATLLQSFKSAVLTRDGALLASLVSPAHGMDARYWRNGRMVNYDQLHAKFLFATTYQVDWGGAAGSGLPTIGSFHEVILPPLHNVFSAASTMLVCNQIKIGGATYQPGWPYSNVNFYSVYYPGTDANNSLDWQTWLVGVEYVQNKPYLYALIHLQSEP